MGRRLLPNVRRPGSPDVYVGATDRTPDRLQINDLRCSISDLRCIIAQRFTAGTIVILSTLQPTTLDSRG